MDSLGTTTWTQLARRNSDIVLAVPLGSCEQHGPHLPLDTDTRIAVEFAQRLADAFDEVIAAPALAFGASWEHAGFPGLMSITDTLLTEVLVEIARSADWASGLVLINGHGGNSRGLSDAVKVITGEGRRAMAWSPRVVGGDLHAGLIETSIMLAIDPAAVDVDAIAPGSDAAVQAVIADGVAATSHNGVLGDPSDASAARGRELVEHLTADLVRSYADWLSSVARPDHGRQSRGADTRSGAPDRPTAHRSPRLSDLHVRIRHF
jgi:mycofactocin precursor peptide peptidase